MDGVRFSISIPQLDYDRFDDAGVKSYLARAEELGFEGGWTLEQVIGNSPRIAPLEMLAYAAACTTRLRLGVAVLITSLHDPLQLASAITAVDRLSHGRLDVGVGHGGNFRPFAAFGVQKATFVSYFTEGIELMKAAWSDEAKVTFHGRFRDVDDLPIQPKPVQRPHPPLWIGGTRTQGTGPRRAARPTRSSAQARRRPATFAEAAKTVRRELDEQGKDATQFTIGKRVYLTIDDDAERARRAGARRPAPHLRRHAGNRRGPGVGHSRRRGPRSPRGHRRRRRDGPAEPDRARTSPRTASRWNGLPPR